MDVYFLDPCALLWSGWSQWGECENKRPDIYLQTRNRSCSRLIGCVGDDYETRHCAPSGIIWGDWTNCSCVYMIQHRYPIFIAGCRKCDALYKPEYRTCKPEGCNFPSKFCSYCNIIYSSIELQFFFLIIHQKSVYPFLICFSIKHSLCSLCTSPYRHLTLHITLQAPHGQTLLKKRLNNFLTVRQTAFQRCFTMMCTRVGVCIYSDNHR